jgi:transposase-like protein
MNKTRRQFSPEEKYSILQESEREGITETCRKYQLSHSVVRYWKEKYLSNGKEGLKARYRRIDPNIRTLEEENARLKKIIARQALELEVKDELLKKGEAHFQRGRRSL